MGRVIGIYALVDPKTGVVRYIGQSHDIHGRFRTHLSNRKDQFPVCRWIQSLQRQGLSPTLRVLEQCSVSELDLVERWWIATAGEIYPLLNLCEGGEGRRGHRVSPEHRRRLSESLKGHSTSEETRRKISAANRGRRLPPRSAQHKGKLSHSMTQARSEKFWRSRG